LDTGYKAGTKSDEIMKSKGYNSMKLDYKKEKNLMGQTIQKKSWVIDYTFLSAHNGRPGIERKVPHYRKQARPQVT
jgi:hypothetical protein